MRQIENSVVIDRPIDVVFAFVADSSNGRKWAQGSPVFEKQGEDPIGVGTTYRFRVRLMGRNVEGTRTYSAFEPNALLVQSNTNLGPVPVNQRICFEPAGPGTKLTFAVEWGHLPGLWRVAEPVIAAMSRRMLPGELARLKAALEQ